VQAFLRILASEVAPEVIVLADGPGAPTRAVEQGARPKLEETPHKDQVEPVLAKWWQELLGVEQVGLDDDFFELGGQSLTAVRLFSRIKKTYGIDFGLSTSFEGRTVRKLAQLIREASTKSQSEPERRGALVAIHSKGTHRPLFVISGLGGNVINFQSAAFHLGEDQPVFGLVPRGLDGGEPYDTRVEDMAAYYVEAIREVQPEGPYRVVGYSFGGIVAFEVAQQFVGRFGGVSLLGMFDTIEWRYRNRFIKSRGFRERLAGLGSEFEFAMLDRQPLRPLRMRFKSKMSKVSLPFIQKAPGSVLRRAGTIKEVQWIAAAHYRPKPYPGRLTLFRATSKGPLEGDDDFLGWGPLVSGGIDVHDVPSSHSTILSEPVLKILSQELRECLKSDSAYAIAH